MTQSYDTVVFALVFCRLGRTKLLNSHSDPLKHNLNQSKRDSTLTLLASTSICQRLDARSQKTFKAPLHQNRFCQTQHLSETGCCTCLLAAQAMRTNRMPNGSNTGNKRWSTGTQGERLLKVTLRAEPLEHDQDPLCISLRIIALLYMHVPARHDINVKRYIRKSRRLNFPYR